VSEFKIEKGIPIPDGRSARKYPWREMGIGDSVFIQPAAGRTLEQTRMALSNSLRMARPFRFTTKVDKENNGVRIWRTE